MNYFGIHKYSVLITCLFFSIQHLINRDAFNPDYAMGIDLKRAECISQIVRQLKPVKGLKRPAARLTGTVRKVLSRPFI